MPSCSSFPIYKEPNTSNSAGRFLIPLFAVFPLKDRPDPTRDNAGRRLDDRTGKRHPTSTRTPASRTRPRPRSEEVEADSTPDAAPRTFQTPQLSCGSSCDTLILIASKWVFGMAQRKFAPTMPAPGHCSVKTCDRVLRSDRAGTASVWLRSNWFLVQTNLHALSQPKELNHVLQSPCHRCHPPR